jgi:hypothetical protein
MSWRLWKIGIYSSKNGELQPLTFHLSGLSIISGESATGKSALMDIVDYCMMTEHCPIAQGVIRKTVSHVGVVLVRGTDPDKSLRLAIVRSLPRGQNATSSEVYLADGPNADLPSRAPRREEMRWNVDTAKEVLSDFTGVEAVPIVTNYTSSAPGARRGASIRHAAPYLFQPQDVIASRTIFLPGLEDGYRRQAIIDTAPYFLGVIDKEFLALRQELHDLQNAHRIEARRVEEMRRLKDRGFEHGRNLRGVAISLGLLPEQPEPGSPRELVEMLATLRNLQFEMIAGVAEPPALLQLQSKEAELRRDLAEKRTQLAELDRFEAASKANEETVSRQVQRLELVELLPPLRPATCPLCLRPGLDGTPIESAVREGIAALNAVRSPPKRLRSRMTKRREDLRQEIDRLSVDVTEFRERIAHQVEELDRNRRFVDQARERERVIGRIDEYVRSIEGMTEPEFDKLRVLEERIHTLESQIGDAALEARMTAVAREIEERMTGLTNRLDVEFPGRKVRINFDQLSLELAPERPDAKTWVKLTEVGSGANWLSYHLVGVIALHERFLQSRTPVPSFLMLDQPSQVWFPAKVAKIQRARVPRVEKDIRSLSRLYELLYSVSLGANSPQIIVVDHAHLENSQAFRDGLIDEWRNGKGLVPKQWKLDAGIVDPPEDDNVEAA